jgi:DNA primase
MARIPDAFIDDLLARTDLVELIGTRVPLKRQGREYSARCPFHDERSPSFTVSPTKQFYHCFGCGAHGTALSFLMNYDRLEFLDAVEELAKRVGVEVPRDTRARNEDHDGRDQYAALDAAARFFQAQLGASEKARTYLERRGVDGENQARFGIGYAPDSFDGLKSALGTDERRLALLEKTGMFSRSDSGRVYDKFRDRLMFPIHDRRGRVIAFGGRVLDKDDGPKYLNSPETPLFHKGRELYGLWQVRQAHSKIPRLVVVEGYMDVVSLFQFGITEAVATLGTATTPDHAETLFRNAESVYFCFDGDNAGRKAAWKAIESVVGKMRDGRRAFFMFLPEGDDPDTIVRREGAAGFDLHLERALPLSSFLFREIERDVNVHTVDGKARVWELCKPLIATMPEGAFKDGMIEMLHERAGNPNKLARAQLGTGGSLQSSRMNAFEAAATSLSKSGTRGSHPKQSLVRTAVAFLLHNPALASEIDPPHVFAELRQPGVPLLLEVLELARSRSSIGTEALLQEFAEREEYSALMKLAVQSFPGDVSTMSAEFRDTLLQLDRQTRKQRIADLQAKGALSQDEKSELRGLLTSRV